MARHEEVWINYKSFDVLTFPDGSQITSPNAFPDEFNGSPEEYERVRIEAEEEWPEYFETIHTDSLAEGDASEGLGLGCG